MNLKDILNNHKEITFITGESYKYNIGEGDYLYSFKSNYAKFNNDNISINYKKYFGITINGYAEHVTFNKYSNTNVFFSFEKILNFVGNNYPQKQIYYINKKDPYYVLTANKNHIIKLISKAVEELINQGYKPIKLSDEEIQKLIKEDADYPIIYTFDGFVIKYWYNRVCNYEGDEFSSNKYKSFKSDEIGSSFIFPNKEIKNYIINYIKDHIILNRTKKIKTAGVLIKETIKKYSDEEIEKISKELEKEYFDKLKNYFFKYVETIKNKALWTTLNEKYIFNKISFDVSKDNNKLKEKIFDKFFYNHLFFDKISKEFNEKYKIITFANGDNAIIDKNSKSPIIHVDKHDIGKIIGKNGKNIKETANQYGLNYIKVVSD